MRANREAASEAQMKPTRTSKRAASAPKFSRAPKPRRAHQDAIQAELRPFARALADLLVADLLRERVRK